MSSAHPWLYKCIYFLAYWQMLEFTFHPMVRDEFFATMVPLEMVCRVSLPSTSSRVSQSHSHSTRWQGAKLIPTQSKS